MMAKEKEEIGFVVEIKEINRQTLIECENLGIIKKYDLTPEDREAHDKHIAAIREDKTLSIERKVELYNQEDRKHGKF